MAPDRFTALLGAAREGDESAWAEIFDDLAPSVLGYLRGSSASDPEDVMGECFLQVSRDIAHFDGDYTAFKGWVFTVAHHRLIDARRREARRPAEPVDDVPETAETVGPDAADEALARIGSDTVREVLSELSPDQRAVLLLRIVGDLSLEQVADALGKRTGAVKQLQRRGLASVKRILEQKGVTP